MMKILALVVLALFYGIYFSKLIAQKRRGIRTNQIGSRKEKTLHRVELLMSAATVLAPAAQLLAVVFDVNRMPDGVRRTGFVIGLTGDVVFLAAVLCMKDSWRAGIPENDKTSVVTRGIYAFSRNPAFLGFDLMYIGIFLMYANWLTGITSAFAIIMLHFQILQEEKYLETVFGKEYTEYKRHVFRYLGRK